MNLARLLSVLVVVGHASLAGAAQDPHAQAVRVTTAPVIDGRVDDPAWTLAPAQDSFTQVEPAQGATPTEKTQFRLAYDDGHLYVAVSCLDSDPRGIVSRLTRRDRDIEGDWVAISIDSRNSRNSAFLFQLSAAGVQVDGQVFNDTDSSLDWDAVWKGAVAKNGEGWTAEFAIPLTVLRFSSADDQSWGLQVHRNVSRKREQMMWSYDGSGRTWGVSHFGHVDGLKGLRPHRALELRPFIAAGLLSANDQGGGFFGSSGDSTYDTKFDVGLDAKVGLTPRLTMDLTVNPDFGQVEADQVVLNLSRFETFFPEKRPFFLEGTDVFSTTIQLFYPRRIGRPLVGLGRGDTVEVDGMPLTITEAGGALRLWTAAKMTGEIGDKLSLGVLGALVGSENLGAKDEAGSSRDVTLAPMRAFGVLRTRYALGNGSFVGLMGTSATRLATGVKRADADHDGYVQAVDGFVKSSNGRFVGQAQLAVSERVGGPSFKDAGGRACTDEQSARSLYRIAPNPPRARTLAGPRSARVPASDFACVPITRADGTRMGPGAVGVGLQARTIYETTDRLLKVEYTGHTKKFDPNDAGFAPRFNLNEGKLIGGFMKKQPDEWTNFRGIYPFAVGNVSMDGTLQYFLIGAQVEATFKNFTYVSPEQFINFPGSWDIYETLDGARFETPMSYEGRLNFQTNKANALALTGFFNWYLALGEEPWSVSTDLTLGWQAASNLELSLGGSGGRDHAVRFHDCSTDSGRSCLLETGLRHYRFADLDSKFLSLTLRGTLTLRPTLSFQAYAQYFVAEGDFSDYREIDTMGDKPEIRRRDLRPSTFNGDSDGDGVNDDGFETASVNANFVVRWEPRPGSTLYAVYTRAQESPMVAPSKLDRGPTEDLVLLKFVYFLN